MSELSDTKIERLTAITEVLTASPDRLYAIVDAAQDWQGLQIVMMSGAVYESLYEGEAARELAGYAPYLVDLTEHPRLVSQLVQLGWDSNWAVYTRSSSRFSDVRRHFRKYLMIRESPDANEPVYFRFYDGYLLGDFLPSLNPTEVKDFFGPLDLLFTSAEDSGQLVLWKHDRGVLQKAVLQGK